MFLLNVFFVYIEELEKVYFNRCTEMFRDYSLNMQFCIVGYSQVIISCYSAQKKPISASTKIIHLCEYNYCEQ